MFFAKRYLTPLLLACFLSATLFCSCEDEETGLGMGLQTDSPYNGIYDTIAAPDLMAYTCYDDSLLTTGDTFAVIGRYSDAVFGQVEARCYAQLALTNNSGLDFSSFTIDSAILSISLRSCFPAIATGSRSLHLKVFQLAEPLDNERSYYAFDSVALSFTLFFEGTFVVDSQLSKISVPLNAAFSSLLNGHVFESQQQFQDAVKGLCIVVCSDSDPAIITLDLGSNDSGLKLYYNDLEGTKQEVSILFGKASSASSATHFTRFIHNYSGNFALLQDGTLDSIEGSQKLFLEPMAGTQVVIDVNAFITAFRSAHPRAVIHYAEMILPVHADADAAHPYQIVASVIDYVANNSGYDGTYNAADGCYHIRMSRHMQMLLSGFDTKLRLAIRDRRSFAPRTILNGTATSNPPKIAFIYTE